MSTAFPDVKPWPKAPAQDANPRAAIGGNRPPLEESIVLDFEEALRGREGLIDRIAAMEEKAADPKPCTSAEMAGRYGDFIKMTSAAAKAVEEEREKLNRPILTAQRALKAKADSYSQRAAAAGAKVRVQLDAYLAEEEKKRRAEAARLAEVERQAAAARQAIIDEANRKAAAEAEAERARLQAIEDARAAAEKREATVVEVEPEPVIVAAPQPAFSVAATRAPIRGDYGTAVSTVETWDVKVVNIRQVPDAYLRHPTVIEALEKVIRPQVRGKNGLREIKGCEITSTLGSSVR
jgi:hypothetical protein